MEEVSFMKLTDKFVWKYFSIDYINHQWLQWTSYLPQRVKSAKSIVKRRIVQISQKFDLFPNSDFLV